MNPRPSSKPSFYLLPLLCLALAAVTGLGGPAFARADEAKVFAVELPSPEVPAGKTSAAPVTFKPAEGWKWNHEYPAKITVEVNGPAIVTPTRLAQLGGGAKIQTHGKEATLPLVVEGKSAGTATVTLKGSFSICSKDSCKVFRNQTFTFKVVVK